MVSSGFCPCPVGNMYIKKEATQVMSCGDNFIEKEGNYRLDDGNIVLRSALFNDELKFVGIDVAFAISYSLGMPWPMGNVFIKKEATPVMSYGDNFIEKKGLVD
ncbi:hypothetical protein BUALT_Bualt07G0120900 [Buddleja alternifolia]|uniref:Uncharacterized protein n=1 Tax=Buddleja alternifolia TaxID=168488 RepID=A0AAV6XGT7_9LAMI|nr:hypothetical protein BUALT_Bualt07G0120900 [Buddleja alternifolia]